MTNNIKQNIQKHTGNWTVSFLRVLIGSLTALFVIALVYLSVKGTYFTPTDYSVEKLQYKSDFLPWHFLAFSVFLVIFSIYDKFSRNISEKKMLLSVMLISFCLGCIWVKDTHALPQADQAQICSSAAAFNAGDFSDLEKGGYLGIYRNQLGLVTFLRVFFAVFGTENYLAFEYLNALAVSAICFAGYKIVWYLCHKAQAQKLYLLLYLFAFPVYFYTPYVYGEILSTALVMLAVLAVLSALECFTWKKAAAGAALMGMAMQIRENTVIVLIAVIICLLIRFLADRSGRILLLAAAVIAGAVMFQIFTNALYMKHIPEDSKPMPSSLWIAMGITDNDQGPGRWNAYSLNTYASSNFDPAVAGEQAQQLIQKRIDEFLAHPGMAFSFFYRKLATQWGDPMYESLKRNNSFFSPPDKASAAVYYGDQNGPVLQFMNYMQSYLYFSLLLYVIKKLLDRDGMETLILPLTVLGGGMFTLMWEAMGRYAFPYYVLMIPCAAAVTEEMLVFRQNRKNTDNTDRKAVTDDTIPVKNGETY